MLTTFATLVSICRYAIRYALLPCPVTIGLAVLSELIGPNKGRKEEVGSVIVLRNGRGGGKQAL